LDEFYRRLGLAPDASTFEEALGLIRRTLNEVEDELSGFPMNPDPPLKSAEDRMYPPELDQIHDVPGSPKVKRLRSRYHNTFVGENGAIEIRSSSGTIEFFKPGADGKTVSEL